MWESLHTVLWGPGLPLRMLPRVQLRAGALSWRPGQPIFQARKYLTAASAGRAGSCSHGEKRAAPAPCCPPGPAPG